VQMMSSASMMSSAKVIIFILSADFGLAKQKRSDTSKMTSVVGTILYNCPEIVQYEPYGEKADIWAIGCILYQMCSLQPPFMGSNMLALVLKVSN
jgi:NIMA (never in mitosis gene a)-related kinase